MSTPFAWIRSARRTPRCASASNSGRRSFPIPGKLHYEEFQGLDIRGAGFSNGWKCSWSVMPHEGNEVTVVLRSDGSSEREAYLVTFTAGGSAARSDATPGVEKSGPFGDQVSCDASMEELEWPKRAQRSEMLCDLCVLLRLIESSKDWKQVLRGAPTHHGDPQLLFLIS